MKYELLLIFSVLALGLLAILVTADPISSTGLPVTITIGLPSSTTTESPQNTTINNPANISFQIGARDSTGQSQPLNVSLYDGVNHHFLNNSNFVGYNSLFSPTSLADFEIDYDNQNLDVLVNGLQMDALNSSLSQITIENSQPQISNFTLYRAYHVELPWNSSSYNSITLSISLAGISNINYSSIVVYRCESYSIITNVCSDSGGWAPQTISVNSANNVVSLNINHFSVYAVGSSNSVAQTASTTTTTTTTTATSSAPATNSGSSSSGSSGSSSSGGGGGALPPLTTSTTTTPTPTTTSTVLIIRQNSTGSSSSATTETAPISGLLGLTSMMSPLIVAGVIIVVSIAAIAWLRGNYDVSQFKFWERSYKTFPTYKKTRKTRKNTELKLSL